jgi:putative SOS response-associated peptidase YedK
MPVIHGTSDEIDLWMTAPPADALTLQKPLPDDTLRIVAHGVKQDDPESGVPELIFIGS